MLLAALLCGSACGDAPEPPVVIEGDSAGVAVVVNRVGLSSDSCSLAAEPRLRIGTAAGDPDYEFFSIYGVATLSDGRIAVLNGGTEEVRLYDRTGTHVRTFGRRGGGPGEFRSVLTLNVVSGDTLVVGDYRPWRFNLFTPDGEFLRTVEPENQYINTPRVMEMTSQGEFLLGGTCCRPQENEFVQDSLILVIYDRSGALVDSLGSVAYRVEGYLDPSIRFIGPPLFAPFTDVELSGETYLTAYGRSPEIEVRGLDGALRRLIRWTAGDRAVTPEDVEAYRDQILEAAAQGSARLRPYTQARISDERPVADSFPTHAGLALGRDGNLWVQQFRRPGDAPRRRWLRFDSAGRFRCHLTVPDGFVPYEYGSDYLLGVHTDELDVETVVSYHVEPPRRLDQ